MLFVLVVVVPFGLLPFSLVVGSISENNQRRAELGLSEIKRRAWEGFGNYHKLAKRILESLQQDRHQD